LRADLEYIEEVQKAEVKSVLGSARSRVDKSQVTLNHPIRRICERGKHYHFHLFPYPAVNHLVCKMVTSSNRSLPPLSATD